MSDETEEKKMWVIQWSEAQGYFHLSTIDEAFKPELRAYVQGIHESKWPSYFTLAVVHGTHWEASQAITKLEAKREQFKQKGKV